MSKARITTEKRTARDGPTSTTRQSRQLPPIHPGDVLTDTLREAGISATSAAIAMGLPPSTLTRIIKGHRNVTAPIALRIARYFGTSPDIWIRIQTAFDLEIAKDREGARIERDVRPLGSASGYEVACLRYTAGDTPTCRMNQCDKWLCEEKPDDNATSTTGKSVFRNNSLARSMRRPSTY